MFEQLFGSKTRVKLMRLFLENPERKFYVRELTRETDSLINSIRRELANLEQLKFVLIVEGVTKKEKVGGLRAKKFYQLNSKNIFQQDLLSLFSKGKVLVERKFVEKLKALGPISYLALGGFFVEDEKATTDLLLIGDVDRGKAVAILTKFEKEIKKAIRYTIMDTIEFQLRQDINDRFLKDIIKNEKNVIMIDERDKAQKPVSDL